MPDLYKPRIGIEVTQSQFDKMQKYIPWGLRRLLFSAIIDDLIDVIEKTGRGPDLIGAIIAREIGLKLLIKELKNEPAQSEDPSL